MATANTTKKAKGKRPGTTRVLIHPAVEGRPVRRSDTHPLDRAIAELRGELARTPEDATLLGRLAALYYRRGDLEKAENHYRRALELAPQRPSLHNNLGNVLCDRGRMREGIAEYESALALQKSQTGRSACAPEAAANLELARLEYRLIHERVEYLERAVALDVSSAEAFNALGCAYLLRGNPLKAMEAFRKAGALDPANRYAALNLAFAHTVNLGESSDLKAALFEVTEALARFPLESRLHIHQGELLENAGMLEGAEQRYLRALQVDARCLEAYDLLGRLREVTGFAQTRDELAGSVDAILKELVQAALRQQAATPHCAQALYDLACADVARARFERYPPADTTRLDTLLREAGCAAQAQSAAGEISSTRSVAVPAAILRAQLLEGEGRRADARTVLEQAGQQEGPNARLWFEFGSLAVRSGDVAGGLEAFERATVCAPQDALPCYSLRFALEGYRRYRTERVRFDSAVQANPRDALAHHHLALAALAALKDEEALFNFTRALELDGRLSDASCGRGRALQRQGHMAEAEAAFAKALDIDPENGEAQRALMALRSQKLLHRGAQTTEKKGA